MELNPNKKKILREKLKIKRKLYHQKNSAKASKMILGEFKLFLQQLQKHQKINNVAVYFPINSEINIISIIEYLNNESISTVLPKVNLSKDILEFFPWKPGEQIKNNDTNFYEPKISKLIYPDLILIPMLGFDKNGHRIGYGKGLYDKTLPYHKKAFHLGCAYSMQEVREIPNFKHDIKMNGILTEKELLDCIV